MTHAQFQQAFWGYLTRGPGAYKNWKPFPGYEAEYYEGQSPHGAFLKIYANSFARNNPKAPPHGSIIVKENYTKEKELAAVTVMYRPKGYNPQAGDWYWIKYNANGAAARAPADKGGAVMAGRVNGCIQCHADADGRDYVFAND